MSVSGLCTICERRQAEFACDRCGALVCSAHYATDFGLCRECARTIPLDDEPSPRS